MPNAISRLNRDAQKAVIAALTDKRGMLMGIQPVALGPWSFAPIGRSQAAQNFRPDVLASARAAVSIARQVPTHVIAGVRWSNQY